MPMRAVTPEAGRPAPPVGAPCRRHVPAEQQRDQTVAVCRGGAGQRHSRECGLSTSSPLKDSRATRLHCAPLPVSVHSKLSGEVHKQCRHYPFLASSNHVLKRVPRVWDHGCWRDGIAGRLPARLRQGSSAVDQHAWCQRAASECGGCMQARQRCGQPARGGQR